MTIATAAARQPTNKNPPAIRSPGVPRTVLRLSPSAWAKLAYLRDAGPTEIGGFGISAADDLLLVQEVSLVRQECDWASVVFDDASVADFFDRQVDANRAPAQFARIWVHTHPGNSAQPSLTDEATFARVFGRCDWAVMLIVARGGATYARLQFGVGPSGALEIPVQIDWDVEFGASDWLAWQAEYTSCVFEAAELATLGAREGREIHDDWDEYAAWLDDEPLWRFPTARREEADEFF